jgi:hypothetical protein
MEIICAMQDLQLAEFYGKKKNGGYLKDQINELERSSKNKTIRDLYSGRNLLLYLFIRR